MEQHETPAAQPATPAEQQDTASAEPTAWHLILGMLLKARLGVVGVTVQLEVPVTRQAQKIDILLLRREGASWTAAQRLRLPDGLRQRHEANLLCEFKYTESVNRDALVQALNYETLYRLGNGLNERAIATFVVSAKTPQRKFLTTYGYTPSAWPGVYHTSTAGWARVGLLVLNELQPAPHNAFFQCFASRKAARQAAFTLLEQLDGLFGPASVWEMVAGLRSLLVKTEQEPMNPRDITPEYVQSLGAGIRRMIINTLTPSERLEGLAPQERLEGLTPAEVLKHYAPQERLEGLAPQERLEGLAPQERLEGLAPQERLEGLAPQERLAGLTPDEVLASLEPAVIEAYLRRQTQSAPPPPRRRRSTGKTKTRKQKPS